MKLASADLIVWAIIAIVVAIAKGIGKLSSSAEEEIEIDDTPAAPPVARPRPGARPRAPRPIVQNNIPPAVPTQIRAMMEQLAQPKRPTTPSPTPPPLVDAPAPVAAKTHTPPPTEPLRPSRSSQWATALRDKSNIRNIIIAAEIIGPPKSTSL
jgi:hypothetical protein